MTALFDERFGGVDWPAASSGEERAAEPGILLVAVDDDGTVVGFTHVLDLDGHWHLEQIAVDPAHGRRGIGSQLLEATHAELVALGAREVTLRTYADVPWNGPFYASTGTSRSTSRRSAWSRCGRPSCGWGWTATAAG